MARLNLTAEGKNQAIVLAYLEENASDSLVERINSGKKTMRDCWTFITQQARKTATNNCACIEDREVFGWAIHFFEEDGITVKAAEAARKDEEVNPKIKERYEKTLEEQHKKMVEQEEKKKAAKEAEKKAAEERKAKEREDRKNVPGQLDMFSLLGGV